MQGVVCNIDRTDRINRTVIGVLLLLGALIGLGKVFMVLLGLILIVQGSIGWCSIPILTAKWEAMQKKP
jgi:hypothetical protein